jgi:hypothetical protein
LQRPCFSELRFKYHVQAVLLPSKSVSKIVHCQIRKVSKGIPRQAEVALRPRIITTFGTTRVVGRQPNAPATFTPEEIPGTHFKRRSRPQNTWLCRKEPRKKSPVTPPGIDPGTVRLVAQPLNYYATVKCVMSVMTVQVTP